MSGKIKVNLFTNYTGDAQFSMLAYAEQLEKSLRFSFPDQCELSVHAPSDNSFGSIARRFPAGRKMASYWNRFVIHLLIAKKISGGINHITDHNNSYLIRYLDPERTVITCHDLIYFRIPDDKGEKRNRFSLRHAVRNYTVSGLPKAARIIADSENTKRDIMEVFGIPGERIEVVYPGIKSCFRRIEDREILNKGKEKFGLHYGKTILHVGQSYYNKNIEGILHALYVLHGKGEKSIHLVKAGKDFSPGQKELILRLGMGNYVHYLGDLTDEDLNLLYNLVDALVFPSLYEGFGWPPLEAMACGTPVVCSDRGSLKEIAGDAALIVDPYNHEEISEAITLLLSNPSVRKEKIRQGFENVKRFDWRKTAEAVFNVYNKVLGKY